MASEARLPAGCREHRSPGLLQWDFEDAERFLDALNPARPWWLKPSSPSCSWLFRGHACSSWPLLPRAWREDGLATLRPLRGCQDAKEFHINLGLDPDNRSRQLEAATRAITELRAVADFIHQTDKLGLPIPGGLHIENGLEHHLWCNTFEPVFPAHPLMASPIAVALAQHHGIPTRLLDFTRRPLVAAYFAAEDVSSTLCDETVETMAVWALNEQAISAESSCLRVLNCPRHLMAFLHAQSGAFVYSPQAAFRHEKTGLWQSIDWWFGEGNRYCSADYPALRKLTLSRKDADEVLRHLFAHEISRAHLMPTLDNVSKTIRKTWQWEFPTSGSQ